MRIFLSHSARDKSLVREMRSYLSYLDTWLDEEQLIIGGPLATTIQAAIQEESDFVLLFLSRTAVESVWVKRELAWAIERERQLKRVFILPILLDEVWNTVEPAEFRKRVYVSCLDQSSSSIRAAAETLGNHLFQRIIGLLDEARTKVTRASPTSGGGLSEKIAHSLEMARLFPFGRAGYAEQLVSLAGFLSAQFPFGADILHSIDILSRGARIDDLDGEITQFRKRFDEVSDTMRFSNSGVDLAAYNALLVTTNDLVAKAREIQEKICGEEKFSLGEYRQAKCALMRYLGECHDRLGGR